MGCGEAVAVGCVCRDFFWEHFVLARVMGDGGIAMCRY